MDDTLMEEFLLLLELKKCSARNPRWKARPV